MIVFLWPFYAPVFRPFDILDRHQIAISHQQSSRLISQADRLVPATLDGIAELIESDDAAELFLALRFELK